MVELGGERERENEEGALSDDKTGGGKIAAEGESRKKTSLHLANRGQYHAAAGFQ